jgi:hypothetical protein
MHTIGQLASIWRYPVKSLAAQALDEVAVDRDGLAGDRVGALYVTSQHAREGKPYRGKENDRLHLTHDVAQAARYAAESGVRVEYRCEPSARVFDDAPVSLIVDRWIDEVSESVGQPLDPRTFHDRALRHDDVRRRFGRALGRRASLRRAPARQCDGRLLRRRVCRNGSCR